MHDRITATVLFKLRIMFLKVRFLIQLDSLLSAFDILLVVSRNQLDLRKRCIK